MKVKPRGAISALTVLVYALLALGCNMLNQEPNAPGTTALTRITVSTAQEDDLWVINAAEVSFDGVTWHAPAQMTFAIQKGKYTDGLFMGHIQQQAIGELASLFGKFGIATDLDNSLIVNGAAVTGLKAIGDLAVELTALKQVADPVSLSMCFIQGFEAMRAKIQGYDRCLALGPGDKVTFSMPENSQEKPSSVRVRYTVLNWPSISREQITVIPRPQCSFPLPPMTFDKWAANPSPGFFGKYWNWVAGPTGDLSNKWALLNLDSNPTAWNVLVCDIRPTLPELRTKYVSTGQAVVDRPDDEAAVHLTLAAGTPPTCGQKSSATIPANILWCDTKTDIGMAEHVIVDASGSWTAACRGMDPIPYFGPDGYSGNRHPYNQDNCPLPSNTNYALVGRIGDHGIPFLIGSHIDFISSSSGRLFACMNDEAGYFGDNAGDVTLNVTLTCLQRYTMRGYDDEPR